MGKHNVVAWRYLPARLPFGPTFGVVVWNHLWPWPQWALGAAGFVLGLVWILNVTAIVQQRQVHPSEVPRA